VFLQGEDENGALLRPKSQEGFSPCNGECEAVDKGALPDAHVQIVGGDIRGMALARQCITSSDDWTTPKDDRLSVADAEALLRPVQRHLKNFLDRLEASRKFAAHPGPSLPFNGECQFLLFTEGNLRRILYLPKENSASDRLAKMLLLRLGTFLTLLALIRKRAVKRCCALAGASPAWGIVGAPQ
jgi:hypothetical protein